MGVHGGINWGIVIFYGVDTPMSLSDTTCKNVKPKEKPFKLADEKGMFLLINTNGSKYFRFKYRFAGKEKL